MPPRTQTSVGMETVNQTVARAQKLVPRNNQTSTPKVDVSGSTVVSPESLATPSPMQITPAPVDTATPGLQGMLETAQGTTDTFLQDLTAQKQTAEQGKTNSMQAYIDFLLAPGETALTAQQYATEGGVDAIQQELDAVNNQILQEQNSLRRKIERIQSSGGGLASGAEAEINNLERESLAKQADLYVIQMGVQGRFDSAKAIADRAVAAQLEADKQRQEILGLIYQDNKEQFTKAEQREFETKQADRNREIEERAANKQATYELAIQAQMDGAPTAVVQQMMGAKSKEEALAIGGSYIGALDREAKRANIAQGWANLAIRQEELAMSREKLDAELKAKGNTYGTIDGQPQNATQALVNSYANRLLEAETVFDAVASEFADPLALGGILPSQLQTGQRQQYEQAKRNFVNAVLRRESGAVISEEEFKNAELQYFPQAGDKPETVLQKEQNRNTVINNFYREANVPRPVFSGDIIESNGVKYQVADDGVTLIPLD